MLRGTSTQDGVSEACVYARGSGGGQSLGHLRERSARIAHVIDNQTATAFYVADDVHYLGHIGLIAALITQRQLSIEPLCVSSSAFGASRVGRHDCQVRESMFLVMANEYRRRVQVIHRNIKEPLNLRRMQVHRQDSLSAGGGQQICHELSRDGHARPVLLIRSAITVVRK